MTIIDEEDFNWFRKVGEVTVQKEKLARNLKLLSRYKYLISELRTVAYIPHLKNVKEYLEGEIDSLERFILDRMINGDV